jgi:hypothetical protein
MNDSHQGILDEMILCLDASTSVGDRLAEGHIAIRGIEAWIALADTFQSDRKSARRPRSSLADAFFDASDCYRNLIKREGHWFYDVPPVARCNWAGVPHSVWSHTANGVFDYRVTRSARFA